MAPACVYLASAKKCSGPRRLLLLEKQFGPSILKPWSPHTHHSYPPVTPPALSQCTEWAVEGNDANYIHQHTVCKAEGRVLTLDILPHTTARPNQVRMGNAD